jgi:mannosyltransferase
MKKSKKGKPAPVPENTETSKFKIDYCISLLLLLTAVGAIMRLYNLGFNSLWLDEISTYRYAIGSFEGMWQMMSTGTDYSPPLFFVLEHFMLQVLGVTEWSMRIIPAIFSIATIPAIYLVGKEFKDKYVGLIAAAFFTFSPFLLWYSQDARPYGVALFFVTVMFLFYLKAEKSDNTQSWKDWALFGAFSALAFWTHYYTIVFTGALISYTLLLCIPKIKGDLTTVKTTVKNVAISIGVMGLLALPLIVELIHVYTLRTAKEPGYGMRGFDIITQSILQITYSSEMYMWIITSLFVITVVFLLLTKDRKNAGLLIWIPAVLFIISFYMSYKIPFLPRYLIFLVIPFALGLGMLSTIVKEGTKIKHSKLYIVTGIVIVLGLVFIPYGQMYYTHFTKEDWSGISKDLASITVPGDTVVTMPLYINMPLDYYYNSTLNQVKETGIMSVEELDPIKNNATQAVYYVLTPDIYAADPTGKTVEWLRQNAVQIRDYGYVYLYKGK